MQAHVSFYAFCARVSPHILILRLLPSVLSSSASTSSPSICSAVAAVVVPFIGDAVVDATYVFRARPYVSDIFNFNREICKLRVCIHFSPYSNLETTCGMAIMPFHRSHSPSLCVSFALSVRLWCICVWLQNDGAPNLIYVLSCVFVCECALALVLVVYAWLLMLPFHCTMRATLEPSLRLCVRAYNRPFSKNKFGKRRLCVHRAAIAVRIIRSTIYTIMVATVACHF